MEVVCARDAILEQLGDLFQGDGFAGWCGELLLFVVVKPVQATAFVGHARSPCGRARSEARRVPKCLIALAISLPKLRIMYIMSNYVKHFRKLGITLLLCRPCRGLCGDERPGQACRLCRRRRRKRIVCLSPAPKSCACGASAMFGDRAKAKAGTP